METTQLPDLETKSFSFYWKSIPKKYIIAGCIFLAVIIILVIAYNIGKKKTQVNHAKPNIQDAEIIETQEENEPDREELEDKVLHFLGKEDYSEADIIQLDIAGKLHWQEACTALGIGKTAYFKRKAKYKQNG